MTKQQLIDLAKQRHVFDPSLSNIELIRRIQLSEGNLDCYARGARDRCEQYECLWRSGCAVESIH